MYLPIDCLYTIGLFTDYKTTLHLLCTLSSIPMEKEFWEIKWQYLYPDKTYFTCFTRQENYLLKESTYSLTYINKDELIINGTLRLNNLFNQYQRDLIRSLTDCTIELLTLHVNKTYIVCKTDNYYYNEFYQNDNLIDCYHEIKKDILLNKNDNYIIINVNKLTLKATQHCILCEYYNKYNINIIK